MSAATEEPTPDPIADADALVAAVAPGLNAPGVQADDVILVTGPWLAGTSSVLAALRERMPQHSFVESDGLPAGAAPKAVVFVVSAAAAVTESDCALLDLASQYTDLVVGAVAKVDAHRNWRDVREMNAKTLAARSRRYERMPWAGVAAAPDLGEPRLDELVEVLEARLADRDMLRRNRLRAWEARLEAVIGRYDADAAGADRKARMQALRERRTEINRERRLAKTERSIALRSQLQQARVQLGYFARNRCNSVRTELQEDVAALGRRRIGDFESYVRQRWDDVVGEVDEGVAVHLGDVASELDLLAPEAPERPAAPDIASPPLKTRTVETRLMAVLAVGFGLGVALAVSRLLAGAAPRLAVTGLAVGALVGLLLAVWVVSIRGLLHDRAVLDRWANDTTGTVRCALEEIVATRVLHAEADLTRQLAQRDEAEAAAAAEQIAAIDSELREHAVATARAAAMRDRRIPPLRRALEVVRADLYGNSSSTDQ
ncbi:hypothetical protein [Mycolicibacterium goodii]|uniref:Uncharacterized protein n=1 Tax=Mycolicibacterium goodii TaxID=134601 RepID=A0A0K0X340_MYCGD|nr:hypothetical protein AFA91_08055 [Mycolicibacterium goodii]